ncbi:MAG: hypothetical protein K2N51_15645 [Lachnospiraceae bacterium]|nr:hypothetical protein [Lachnospiraceae bacterium]
MKTYKTDSPVFSTSVSILETTDTDHADNFNEPTKQLYENTLVVKEQIDKKADKEHTHNYARSSSPGGDAENALKVNGHTVQSDVPVNAKFTDSIYTHPATSGFKHVPSGGSTNQILRYNGDGTAKWDNDYVASGRKAGTSIGGSSTAEGSNNTASNDCSHSEGYNNTSSGGYSHTEGSSNTASGSCSHAEGYNNTASGSNSHVECYKNTASGNYSHAGGAESSALGESSFAHGYVARANKFETAFGKFNNRKSTDVNNEDVALQVGNGYWDASGGVLKNILTLYYNGEFYINGTYHSSGADYAEYFEWLDGNTGNEDRRGYFVTMDGDKIKKANAGDYILGIVSGNPSVIGNSDEEWTGRLVLDEFGCPVMKEIEITRKVPTNIEQEGMEFDEVVEHLTVPEENTEYDPEREYTHRANRPEWDAVGMLGVLRVRDDGSCKVNGFCTVTDGGIATNSENGYRVINRINDHIIKVVFK